MEMLLLFIFKKVYHKDKVYTAVVAALTSGASEGSGRGVGVVGSGIIHSSLLSFITLPS